MVSALGHKSLAAESVAAIDSEDLEVLAGGLAMWEELELLEGVAARVARWLALQPP